MVRSFIVLLLLAVFFLSGMVLGNNQEQNLVSGDFEETIKMPKSTSNIPEEFPIEDGHMIQSTNEYVMDIQESEHFTQKIASFLEEGVKGFYEVVVQIMYQVTQLFFD